MKMNRRVFVKSVAALGVIPFSLNASQIKKVQSAVLQASGFPFNISIKDQNILYNLPEGVRSYVMTFEINELISAYLIYDNKIEYVHVLSEAGHHDNYPLVQPARLYASSNGKDQRLVKSMNFSDDLILTEMIDVLTSLVRS